MKKTTTLKVLNMNCNHCVANITKALASILDENEFTINLRKKEIDLFGDIDVALVKATIEEAGYNIE